MASFNTPMPPTADTVVLRIGSGEILIVAPYGERISSNQTETFTMKSGMSVTANLREAFKTCPMLQKDIESLSVLIDTPTMLIPEHEFDPETYEVLFDQMFTSYPLHNKAYTNLPELHCVVAYAIEKDMMTVIADHSNQFRILPVSLPVWRYLHKHDSGQNRRKLFAYFHDDKTDVFTFRQNRFVFSNTFTVNNEHDALYYLLYTWSQLKLDNEKDELHLIGDVLNRRWINERLKQYLRRPFFDSIEPIAGKMAPSCKPLPADIQAFADLAD